VPFKLNPMAKRLVRVGPVGSLKPLACLLDGRWDTLLGSKMPKNGPPVNKRQSGLCPPHRRAVACTIAAEARLWDRYTFEPFGLSSMAVGRIPLHPHRAKNTSLYFKGVRPSIRDAKVPPYKTALKATICSLDPPTEGLPGERHKFRVVSPASRSPTLFQVP
jgi:hypothetical protein